MLLPPGPFTGDKRKRSLPRTAISHSKTTGGHFRLVVDTEGRMVWRAWNFEPDAGEGLNRYIRTSGIRTDTATR